MASDLHAGSWLLPIQNPPLFFTIPHYMFPIWQVELLLENPLDVFFLPCTRFSLLLSHALLWISWLLGQLAEDLFRVH
jgi:hypothetical protein